MKVWQKAHSLAIATYQTTAAFPKDEIYGLTSQIRRACVSIPANIAEGCGREGKPEFSRFLQIALGSTTELEYHLLLANELKFLDSEEHESLNDRVSEIRKMIIGLIQKVKGDEQE